MSPSLRTPPALMAWPAAIEQLTRQLIEAETAMLSAKMARDGVRLAHLKQRRSAILGLLEVAKAGSLRMESRRHSGDDMGGDDDRPAAPAP